MQFHGSIIPQYLRSFIHSVNTGWAPTVGTMLDAGDEATDKTVYGDIGSKGPGAGATLAHVRS